MVQTFMKREYTRRKFIQDFIPMSAALMGMGWVISGCDSEESTQKEQKANEQADYVDPCNDLSGLSQQEIAKRETYGYVTESPYPENLCSNCRLYTPPKSGEECGGCILFEGPVYASGYCNHWEPEA